MYESNISISFKSTIETVFAAVKFLPKNKPLHVISIKQHIYRYDFFYIENVNLLFQIYDNGIYQYSPK